MMRWPTGSVRLRTTVAASLLTAIVLTLASVAIVRLVERDLEQSATEALNTALESQSHQTGQEGGTEGPNEGREGEGEGEGGEPRVVTVDSAIGPLYLLYTDNGEGATTFDGLLIDPEDNTQIALIEIQTTTLSVIEVTPLDGQTLDGQTLDQLQPIALPESLQAGLSGDEQQQQLTDNSIREVRDAVNAASTALLIIVPLVVVILGAAIWFTVGRALQPVRAISNQVAGITSSTLDERVPEPETRDEIAQLASLMNQMLDRLQAGSDRQQQFAADASHELRSPVATIKAAAEIAQVSSDPQRLQTLSTSIANQADRLQTLFEDLLDLARLDEQRRPTPTTTVDLADVTAAVIDRLANDTTATIDLDQSGPVPVQGVESQLERAVHNLIANAINHGNKRAHVTVTTNNGRSMVIVDDDGPGIEPADRDRVFERFVRLDQSRERQTGGTGIGLAVVKAVAQRHNGTITVSESPDLGGSRFTLTLPTTDVAEH